MVVKEENQYAGAQDSKAGDKTVQQSRKQGILLEILERICKGKENIAKKIDFPNPFPVLACLRKQNSEQSCKSGPVTEAKGRRSIQIRIRKQRNKVSSMFPVGV